MYPPHHLGGYELVWQAAMRRARSDGHEVRVLTTGHREPGVAEPYEPDVHRELEWYWHEHEFRRPSLRSTLLIERRNAAILRRHLEGFRPDVVSFWSMGGMSLSLVERVAASDIASALVVHDDWLDYGPRADAWMRRWLGPRRRRAGRIAGGLTGIPASFGTDREELVLANSEYVLRRARDRDYRFARAEVVSPGVDDALLDAADERPWSWRLLCVGRLDARKGIDVALAALEELPREAELTIAGSGDAAYEETLRVLAGGEALRDRVRFAGQVGREDLPRLYAEADAVVFPVRWEEPFGLVPLEAMGVGRPVVATARGGAAEYLRDGENALVVPAGDPTAIARAVERLADDAELRGRLRAGGLATASEHTAADFERRIVEELAGAANAPAR